MPPPGSGLRGAKPRQVRMVCACVRMLSGRGLILAPCSGHFEPGTSLGLSDQSHLRPQTIQTPITSKSYVQQSCCIPVSVGCGLCASMFCSVSFSLIAFGVADLSLQRLLVLRLQGSDLLTGETTLPGEPVQLSPRLRKLRAGNYRHPEGREQARRRMFAEGFRYASASATSAG